MDDRTKNTLVGVGIVGFALGVLVLVSKKAKTTAATAAELLAQAQESSQVAAAQTQAALSAQEAASQQAAQATTTAQAAQAAAALQAAEAAVQAAKAATQAAAAQTAAAQAAATNEAMPSASAGPQAPTDITPEETGAETGYQQSSAATANAANTAWNAGLRNVYINAVLAYWATTYGQTNELPPATPPQIGVGPMVGTMYQLTSDQGGWHLGLIGRLPVYFLNEADAEAELKYYWVPQGILCYGTDGAYLGGAETIADFLVIHPELAGATYTYNNPNALSQGGTWRLSNGTVLQGLNPKPPYPTTII